MIGRKGSVDEGGLRVPFLIRWPGRIRPGLKIPQIASAIDLLPTLADMAEIRVASVKPLDGKSVKPLLLGQSKDWPDRMIFRLQGNKVSVRTQQYRLDPQGRLFDIPADPGRIGTSQERSRRWPRDCAWLWPSGRKKCCRWSAK